MVRKGAPADAYNDKIHPPGGGMNSLLACLRRLQGVVSRIVDREFLRCAAIRTFHGTRPTTATLKVVRAPLMSSASQCYDDADRTLRHAIRAEELVVPRLRNTRCEKSI